MGASLDTPASCPLCSELTRDPVTLKCSHRFCRRCIGDLWSVTPDGPYHCPQWRCGTVYRTLPFDGSSIWPTSSTSRRAQPPSAAGSSSRVGIFSTAENKNTSHVPCHYCPKSGYQSAVKTCLVCGASMCSEHLRPHLDSPVFQNHTLVPPVEDISPWRCQEHQEINRIYCRQCAVCVCTVCTVIGSHRDHVCIGIREAERELRGNLKQEIKQLQDAEQFVENRVTELTQKKETFRVVLSEAREGVQQQYGAIREALEQEEQSALRCVMKEEGRVLGGLEEKLGHLRSSLLSVQQGLHTLEGLADTRGDKRIQEQAFIMEYSKTSQMVSNMGSRVEQFEAPEEVDRARLKCLQRWTEKRLEAVTLTVSGKDRDLYRLLYGTSPLLDADTAHSKLQLSENNRKVTYSEAQQFYPEHEERFSSFPQEMPFFSSGLVLTQYGYVLQPWAGLTKSNLIRCLRCSHMSIVYSGNVQATVPVCRSLSFLRPKFNSTQTTKRHMIYLGEKTAS
ncbi:putative tripartite motif-containing protein 14-like [Scophthalmus maximus]|uniref:Putative tripartite motif-containing protein 14-like n=1 Tax=Scophthalmus maximus TaxID=52904 RepID=A0A2U9BXV3_SCOMX|nr:putative tripartite motif-containing protein 14-like [Scophthalmus maximus]